MQAAFKKLLLSFVFVSSSAFAVDHTKDSIETVKANLASGKAVLIDVREDDEWEEGHINGAVFAPLSKIEKGEGKKLVPKDKILYLHCRSGKRALAAAELLSKQGLADVRALSWGYKDLKKMLP